MTGATLYIAATLAFLVMFAIVGFYRPKSKRQQ